MTFQLIPGIKYILKVKILSAGNPVDEKTLTLDVNEDVETVTRPMISLILSASDTCYAYSTYVINAEIKCSNVSAYYVTRDDLTRER